MDAILICEAVKTALPYNKVAHVYGVRAEIDDHKIVTVCFYTQFRGVQETFKVYPDGSVEEVA